MHCCAYCTAASYPVKKIYPLFNERYKTTQHREVVHIEIPLREGNVGHAFFFGYGVVVFWNLSTSQEHEFIDETISLAEQPFGNYITEEFKYSHGNKAEIKADQIVLPNEEFLSKLTFSHGMAQSVKLEAFEILIGASYEQTRHIPEELAKYGKISLSRKEVRQRIGDLYLTRNSITMHIDVLDLPDFFWDYPEMEPLYHLIAADLDIKNRVEVLNRRLDTIKELWNILGNEMNHQHSSRLEWIIIWLITIEVIVTFGQILHIL